MNKKQCNSCGKPKCSCKNKDFTKAVIQIDNPEQITLMRKVVIPASMGDDTAVLPVVGKYHNVLLYYEANHKSYLYSSDGIPTLLANGLTDYEEAVNLPQINGHTLLGNQTGPELGLQNEISHLEQYARYFDTVADMKASTDLSDGDYARTGGFHSLNDGGGALYKITNTGTADERLIIAVGDTLFANLITTNFVNVCQVGGQQDFTTTCNALLTAGKSVYVPEGDFTANGTIIINSDNVKFICDGNVEFTAENSTFFSIQNQRAVVKFNKRITCPTTSVAVEVCGGNHQVRYCDVFIHYVYTSSIGVLINPNGGTGASANSFRWDRINASEAGIKLATGDTSANWVNSNFFTGGQISAPYGIVTRKGTNQTDAYNGNVFEHIVFAGNPTITIALDLQFCKMGWFNDLRISEDRGGTYDYQLDACSFLKIENFSFINIDRVNILNPLGLSYPNFFKCAYTRDSGDHWLSNSCMELNGKFILNGDVYQPNLAKLEAADDSTTFTLPEFYNDGMVVKIGAQTDSQTYEYSLPDIFERRGIKDFYIYVSNKPQDTVLKVFRSNGTTKVAEFGAGTSISNGLYHVHDYGYAYTDAPTTKVTEVTLVS